MDMKADPGTSQLIKFSTPENSTLGIFLIDHPNLVNNCTGTPGKSDLDTIHYVESEALSTYHKPCKRKRFLWKLANMNHLVSDMSQWKAEFCRSGNETTDINILPESFSNASKFNTLMKKNCTICVGITNVQ